MASARHWALRVIAKSEPLTRATCFEGFAYDGPAVYTTGIFGCGSPNSMDSAFIGTHATKFKELHQDKAWPTVDLVNIMGLQYIMRQNAKSEFTATLNAATGAVQLAPKTVTNFSSSGSLYVVMILIDVVLLVVNLCSSVEIARLMIGPLLVAHLFHAGHESGEQATLQLVENYKAGFSSSLYRSRVVVLALSVSQLISWVIVLPNSVIFTWSTGSKMAKLQAYLSSLRLWVLVLMLVNEIWDWIVLCNERLAYAVTSRTYIATYEILAVGAAVSYSMRQEIFSVGNTKYALEMQRSKDLTSFRGRMTLQNAYNEELDFQLNTPVHIIWLMYKPLVNIVFWSVFFCIIVLIVRFLYHQFVKPFVLRKFGRQTKYMVGKIFARADHESEDDGRANQSEEIRRLLMSPYERLPLEEQLNDPIRARFLVRTSFDIETVRVNPVTNMLHRYILPAYFLEAGVVVDEQGQMHARQGFFKFLEPRLKFDECMPAETIEVLRKIASLRKRVSTSSTAPVDAITRLRKEAN